MDESFFLEEVILESQRVDADGWFHRFCHGVLLRVWYNIK